MRKLFFTCIAFWALFTTVHAQTKTPRKVAQKGVTKPATAVMKPAIAQAGQSERLVEITTNYGIMVAKLYNATPLHRDNFIKLIKEGFYDSLLFHRVIEQFMIQGGDPQSKGAPENVILGNGSAPGERVPAEFTPVFFHKKGALAAARDNNTAKASSNCQFYIVQGKPIPEADMQEGEKKLQPFTYTKTQREIYKRIGGTPMLDQNYTVFGEVISGLNVIDKIARVQRDGNNRPIQNITMKMRLLN